MSGYIRQRPYPVPFQIVHDSAEGKKASEGAVDIVAIHGLGANPETTWLDWTTGVSVNWLKDLLPKHPRIPYARIICFNFDSRWFGSDLPKQTLRGIALQLLDHLNNQKSDKQRPTIFVAHSLGGVILEKALVLANSDGNQYQHLVKTTGGIIFLGTPFRGSSDASQKLSSIIGTIASFVGSTEKGLLEYSVQSESLSELLTDFTEIASRNWLNTGSVFCFYELYESTFSIKKLGIPYEMKTKVVDEISGTIDGAIPIPANVNHFNFNKFGNDQDETYIKISEKITKLSSQAWKVVNENLRRLGQEISEEKRIKTLNWLWHGDFQTRHKDIREERCEGTGEWFLSSDKYLSWICGKSSPILWCEGMPGAGKTFMTSFVLDNLEDRLNQENTAIAFIYFNYQDQEEQNPTKIIACLVKQLISRKTSLPKKIIECYEKLSKETKVPDFSQLLDLLHSLSLEYSTIWIVLDAIDECKEGTRDKVLSSLLVLDPQFFRLFITTRPHPWYPETVRQAREAALNIEITPSQTDLKVYTRQKLESAKQNLQQEFIDTAVSKLIIGADGMFLFIALQINNILEQTSQRGMKRTLDKIPSSLNGLYDLMMKKIDGETESRRTLAKKTIAWVFFSKRPLKKEELIEALAVEEGDRDLDKDNWTDISLIVDVCAGLIANDSNSGTVRLIHKTTQDYLSTKAVIPEAAHVDITKTCITYLSFKYFDGVDQKCLVDLPSTTKFKFLSYAMHNWFSHLKDVGESDTQLAHQLREFLISGDRMSWVLLFPNKIRRFSVLTLNPPIYFAVTCGLPETVKWLLDKGLDAYVQGGNTRSDRMLLCAILMGEDATLELLLNSDQHLGWLNNTESPILHTAALLGRENMVRLLLDRGADIEGRVIDQRTPLHQATSYNKHAIVKLLLDRGADIEARDSYQQTPLYHAVLDENQAMVNLLLDRGADIETRDSYQQTPLYHAVLDENQAMINLLLDRGADIDTRNRSQETPLHHAILRDNQAIVNLLLDRGADIDTRNRSQETPLYHAILRDNQAMVKLLLNRGTDIEARDSYQQTPVHHAILRDNQAMVNLLLDRGADIEARDKYQWTPLCKAISRNNQATVNFLLDRGADIEARDMDQRTPLHQAISNINQEIAKLLLDRGADIEAKDIYQQTPLHLAVPKDNQEMVKLLSDRGADVEARDGFEQTSPHLAVSSGNKAMVKLLLDQGANIEATDIFQQKPSHLSVKKNHKEITMLLLEKGANKLTANRLFRKRKAPESSDTRHILAKKS